MTTTTREYEVLHGNKGITKMWTKGVYVEDEVREQLQKLSDAPHIFKWVAAMPDCHAGTGSTIGSVIATKNVIIPAAVGVDIGCGMMALQTNLTANDLPDNLSGIRNEIEQWVPHGRTHNGGREDKGGWGGVVPGMPQLVMNEWSKMEPRFNELVAKYPELERANTANHLGTLGTGNHFIEICLDESDQVWIMLHSGSRGIGNKIGNTFIQLAKKNMEKWMIELPHEDLAYLPRGTEELNDYWRALTWAQNFAKVNREIMMQLVLKALHRQLGTEIYSLKAEVNCHHNYAAQENHYGENVYVTRKGAVRARMGDLGIIPGSMGAKSFIVMGKGNPESFQSCSHGAGRSMSRTKAKNIFSLEDHAKATAGVECRKDAEVLDETPGAYKDIEAVMEAQKDLVSVVHTLKQVVCVKG